MKNLFTLSCLLILSIGTLLAQSPESFKYQAVIRNNSGEVIKDKAVSIKISILQSSISGSVVYVEDHSVVTNSIGLVNLNIGNGTTSDVFSSIDWSNGPYFTKIELDADGGTSYTEIGTSQLLSVPYALYATKAYEAENTFSGDYNDLANQPIIPEAFSGDYNDLTNLPTIPEAFSRDYNDLNNKPSLFSGDYNDLTNKPTISEPFSGNYNDLTNQPTLFSGNYNDLINKPTIPVPFSGNYNDLDNKPSLFSGDYNELKNKPTIPVAFSGDYDDLSNKPNFFNFNGITSALQFRPFPNLDKKGICFGKYGDADIYSITAYNWGTGSQFPQKLGIYAHHLYLNDAEGWNINNVGIGVSRTTTPASKLEVANGDVFISDINRGVIMKSTNGNCWRVTVDDTGTLVTTQITCPQGE